MNAFPRIGFFFNNYFTQSIIFILFSSVRCCQSKYAIWLYHLKLYVCVHSIENIIKKTDRLLAVCLFLWRRERDSNPRTGISRYTISNRAPSTNSAISPGCCASHRHSIMYYTSFFWIVKPFFGKSRFFFRAIFQGPPGRGGRSVKSPGAGGEL